MSPDWKPSISIAELNASGGCSACALFDWASAACTAYPDGVPMPIASGDVDHMVERPGQVPGIIFTPRPTSA